MNKALVGAAAMLALVGLTACGATPGTDFAGHSAKKATTASSTPDATPADDTSTPEDSDTTTPAGPTTFAIGDTATITQNGKDAATIVVSKSEVKSYPEQDYGSKPKNGVYKLLTVTLRDTGSDTFDINPFDFYVRDAEGNKYEYDNGNSIGAFDRPQLDATTLNPKEQQRGVLVFDVPKGAKELVYAPSDQSLGVWKIK